MTKVTKLTCKPRAAAFHRARRAVSARYARPCLPSTRLPLQLHPFLLSSTAPPLLLLILVSISDELLALMLLLALPMPLPLALLVLVLVLALLTGKLV